MMIMICEDFELHYWLFAAVRCTICLEIKFSE